MPEQRPGGIEHRQKTPRHQPSHPVEVIPGSRLAAITGAFTLQVNSAHVQGLKQPDPGLAISALAADGLIEAVEKPGPVFFLGVQWHPEALSPLDASSNKFSRLLWRRTGTRLKGLVPGPENRLRLGPGFLTNLFEQIRPSAPPRSTITLKNRPPAGKIMQGFLKVGSQGV